MHLLSGTPRSPHRGRGIVSSPFWHPGCVFLSCDVTAFAIGMAYSASNITQSSTPSRRIAMGHALLSYFFGTFVVAVAINLITGLTQGG